MILTQRDKFLVLRFSNHKKSDFISEHLNIIQKQGRVWMLKIGKHVPDNRLNELFSEPGILVLKAPKGDGGKFFLACVDRAFNGLPKDDMSFPQYYYDIVNDDECWNVDSLNGTWFCVTHIEELPDTAVQHLRLCNNNKPVEEVLSHTRSATVYAYSDADLKIGK